MRLARETHLASDADEEKALDIERLHRRQDVQIRRERRLDASGLEDVVFREGDDGPRCEAVVFVAPDADDGLDRLAAQHFERHLRHNPCPLGSIHRRPVLGVENLSVHSEAQLIFVLDVAVRHTNVPSDHTTRNTDRCRPCTTTSRSSTRDIPTAVSPRRGVIDSARASTEEGAGVLHFRDVVRVAQSALAAVVFGRVRRSRPYGTSLLSPVRDLRLGATRERSTHPIVRRRTEGHSLNGIRCDRCAYID